MNVFSDLLKRYRFTNGLSQEGLAKELDVALMTIHRWEKGNYKPNHLERKRIEDHINDKGVFIDPYQVLTSEIQIMQKKIDEFTDYLKRFHD